MNEHLSIDDLSALLDDVLPAASRERASAHLASCAACRAELEALRETVEILRAAPLRPLPAGADLRLPAALLEATPQTSRLAPEGEGHREAPDPIGARRASHVLLRLPRFSLLAAGTLAAAVVLAAGLRLGQRSMDAPIPAAQPAAIYVAAESEDAQSLAPAAAPAAPEQPMARSAAESAEEHEAEYAESAGSVAEEPATADDAEVVSGSAAYALTEAGSMADESAAGDSEEAESAEAGSMADESAAEADASPVEAPPAFEAAMESDAAEDDIGDVADHRDGGRVEPDAMLDAEPAVRSGLPASAGLALALGSLTLLGFLAFLFLRPRG